MEAYLLPFEGVEVRQPRFMGTHIQKPCSPDAGIMHDGVQRIDVPPRRTIGVNAERTDGPVMTGVIPQVSVRQPAGGVKP